MWLIMSVGPSFIYEYFLSEMIQKQENNNKYHREDVVIV